MEVGSNRYRVNFDYEYDLFSIPLSYKKRCRICREFEYLLFYIPLDGCIVLHAPLDHAFMRQVPFAHKIEMFHLDMHSDNWWGALENIKLEQQLNSKITSTQLATTLGINIGNKQVIYTQQELFDYMHSCTTPLVLQSPYLFSGIKQLVTTTVIKKQEYPLIVSSLLNRICDLGILIKRKKINLIYLNKNNSQGGYCGTLIAPEEELIKIISLTYQIAIDRVKELFIEVYTQSERIVSYLSQKYPAWDGDIQIDMFFYAQNAQVYLNPLVELNFRRTMGELFALITQSYQKTLNLFTLSLKQQPQIKGEVMLSPQGRRFKVKMLGDLLLEDYVEILQNHF